MLDLVPQCTICYRCLNNGLLQAMRSISCLPPDACSCLETKLLQAMHMTRGAWGLIAMVSFRQPKLAEWLANTFIPGVPAVCRCPKPALLQAMRDVVPGQLRSPSGASSQASTDDLEEGPTKGIDAICGAQAIPAT